MHEEHVTPIEEIRQEKIKKIAALKTLGIDPYPYTTSFPNKPIATIRQMTDSSMVAVAGRVYSIRAHGGISFADIKDQTGKIQLAFKKDSFPNQTQELFSYLDASDHIEVTGKLFTTKAGELTIDVSAFNFLSKALRPIPNKEDSLQDKELRLRKRYLDLLTNPQTKFVFDTRHKIIRGIRQFFDTKNLTEVETPILQPLYGGANARPFTTHINALDATAYLRIAPELYLKRLVVGGYEGVYEIARNFRNEGVDQTHFPEFTMLEAYVAYMDYQGMMDLMEELLRFISTQILETDTVMVHDKSIDLTGPWARVTMTELLKERLNLDIEQENLATLLEFAQKHNLEISIHPTKGELAFLIFDKLITDSLINPTWVIDYPVEVSPLAKPHRTKPGLTERFELYIGGVELMDGWSELTDPIEQRKRFEAESYRQFDTTETAQPVDEDFLESLEYGLPPFAGVGSGIDRLTMFFTNVWSIQETILFPFKKPNYESSKDVTVEIDMNLTNLPTREEAEKLLDEHVIDEYQKLHAHMVAYVLQAYAQKFEEDANLWYITGLLHDLDYNQFPLEHPHKAISWFKEKNFPEQLIHAIAAHDHLNTKVEPQTRLAKALMATDELSGLIYAYGIIRPEKFKEIKVSSIKEKIRNRSFAPKIPREEIEYSLKNFEVDVDLHTQKMTEIFENLIKVDDQNKTTLQTPQVNSRINQNPKTTSGDSSTTDFSIQEELKQTLPGIFYAYTEINNLTITSTNQELEKLKQQITVDRQSITNSEIKAIPSIKAYRAIVKTSGSDPDRHLPSPEALFKRIAQGKGLYSINTAVDAYNLAVVETSIGLGGFDTSSMQYPITLRFSKEGETMNLLGKEGITQLKQNQIIYSDNQKPITMDLNYRDIEETKITTDSTSIILFADGAPGLSKQEVLAALQKGAEYITKFCGGTQGKIYLVE